MRNFAKLCGLLLVLGTSGLVAQQPVATKGTPGVAAPRGVSTGRRQHSSASTTVPRLNIDQLPPLPDTPGVHRRGGRGRRAPAGSVGKWEARQNRNATVSSAPQKAGRRGGIQPDYTRYKKNQPTVSGPIAAPPGSGRHGPVGGAAPGRPSGLNDATVRPPDEVDPRYAPKIMKSGPTARRMPRPRHPRADTTH